MSGLLRRLTRRPATADENRSPTASSDPAATPATAGGQPPLSAGDDQPTQVIPETPSDPATRDWAIGPTGWSGRASTPEPTASPMATVPIAGQFPERPAEQTAPEHVAARDLPAGVDPSQLEHAPASTRRGRLRRRLRYLRSVRELLLRDLGGLTYEIHRTASTPREAHGRLQRAKAERIAALDAEVRALEAHLAEPHAATTLREAGIGGTCPACGELHASDAHFCARCGTPLDAKARAKREHAAAPDESGALWAGLRGRKAAEPEPADKPAAITGEWLGSADQPTTHGRAPEEGQAAPTSQETAAGTHAAPTTHGRAPEEGQAAPTSHEPAAGTHAAPTSHEPAAGTHAAPGRDGIPAADGGDREDEPVTSVEGRREQA
jgi:hypothetical protein